MAAAAARAAAARGRVVLRALEDARAVLRRDVAHVRVPVRLGRAVARARLERLEPPVEPRPARAVAAVAAHGLALPVRRAPRTRSTCETYLRVEDGRARFQRDATRERESSGYRARATRGGADALHVDERRAVGFEEPRAGRRAARGVDLVERRLERLARARARRAEDVAAPRREELALEPEQLLARARTRRVPRGGSMSRAAAPSAAGNVASSSAMMSSDSVCTRPSSSIAGSRPFGTFSRNERGFSP